MSAGAVVYVKSKYFFDTIANLCLLLLLLPSNSLMLNGLLDYPLKIVPTTGSNCAYSTIYGCSTQALVLLEIFTQTSFRCGILSLKNFKIDRDSGHWLCLFYSESQKIANGIDWCKYWKYARNYIYQLFFRLGAPKKRIESGRFFLLTGESAELKREDFDARSRRSQFNELSIIMSSQ